MAKKTDTKKQILTAAAKLINEDGILALTLDAVAKLAGVSKGGLLYHFPSKEALLEGIVNYLTQDFTNGMTSAVQEDLDEKGKWTRAYTTLTFNQENEEIALNTAFLSAVATNPELLKPMAESLEKLHYQIENDGLDPTTATIIRLAADGIYFNQLFGMNLKKDARKQVFNYLINLTREISK